jgi:uncharacterized protein YecT (DUF1311 family)
VTKTLATHVLRMTVGLLLLGARAYGADAQGGSISGVISSPGDYVPALRVYAIGLDGKTHRVVVTEQNQTKFTIEDVPAGKYHVVGYPDWRNGLAQKSVGWTRAAQCVKGPCDHAPIPVNVAAGKPSDGVLLADWYAPAGRLPPEPADRPEKLAITGADCETLGNGAEADACHQRAYEAEDRAVTAQYDRLVKALAPHPPCRDELQKAERAWLKFRDEHCSYEGAVAEKGRTVRCLRELTIARTAYLQRQSGDRCKR